MKRFFTIAAAGVVAACVGAVTWSYGSQAGGGGGGAGGAAGTSGTSGTGTTAGTSGATATGSNAGANFGAGAGAQVRGGTGGAGVNATGRLGTTGTGVNVNGRVGTGLNAQSMRTGNTDFNGINQTPFFANPNVQRELGLTQQQFEQLSRARQAAIARFNQGVTGLGTDTAAAQRAQNLQEFQTRQNATTNGNVNANGTVGTTNAAQQRAAQLLAFQNRFNTDMNTAVNSTLTDPRARQRFNQLNMQFQGLTAFNDPQVGQQLNLTPQQSQQLTRLNGLFRSQMTRLLRGSRSDPAAVQQQLAALRAQFMQQATGLLTPDQQLTWTQLTGLPFDFPPEAFLPGGDESRSVPFVAQGTGQTGAAQPGTVQPGVTQPGTVQPGPDQPGTVQPGTTQPGATQPAPTQSSPPATGGTQVR